MHAKAQRPRVQNIFHSLIRFVSSHPQMVIVCLSRCAERRSIRNLQQFHAVNLMRMAYPRAVAVPQARDRLISGRVQANNNALKEN